MGESNPASREESAQTRASPSPRHEVKQVKQVTRINTSKGHEGTSGHKRVKLQTAEKQVRHKRHLKQHADDTNGSENQKVT